MYGSIKEHLENELTSIREAGLFKEERIITSPQGPVIKISTGQEVLNFCANNYLGLSAHPEVVQAAKDTLDSHGFGMSSVRFICGTQDIHKQLEKRIADFYQTEDTILYAAAFDANGGLFEPLLGPEDAIISDALNHASIIDGVRLCKAMRYRYANGDMADLEKQLKQATSDEARFKIIVTDGVFSMDGIIADLKGICDLADRYDALVMVDDCHATGFMGLTGRGTWEHHEIPGRVDIITTTFGKALGGALGGCTAGGAYVPALSDEVIMVGDWPERDMVGAHGVGIRTVYARYGDTSGATHSGADYEIDDISQLIGIVDELMEGAA